MILSNCIWLILGVSQIFFHQVDSHLNEEIEIRGFVYEVGEGEYVLSSRPDLRSCCTGKREQIILENVQGEIEYGRAIPFTGRLIERDERFVLEDARRVQ